MYLVPDSNSQQGDALKRIQQPFGRRTIGGLAGRTLIQARQRLVVRLQFTPRHKLDQRECPQHEAQDKHQPANMFVGAQENGGHLEPAALQLLEGQFKGKTVVTLITLDSLIFDISRLISGAALQPSVEIDRQAE